MVIVEFAFLEHLELQALVADNNETHFIEVTEPDITPCVRSPIIRTTTNRDGVAFVDVLFTNSVRTCARNELVVVLFQVSFAVYVLQNVRGQNLHSAAEIKEI